MIKERWRGPLTNKIYNSEWKKDLEKYKLENSINWKLATVKKINEFSVEIETEDNIKVSYRISEYFLDKERI